MRTPSKNKQWNRLSAHGAPESKVIMPRIVYRLALDCFAIWSLLFLGEVNQLGETLFRLLCRCTDAAWEAELPWITTKLPRKSMFLWEHGSEIWAVDVQCLCRGYFTEAFITSKASVLTLYKDVVRRSVRKWRPPCDFYSFRTIRVWVVWRFSWKAASSRCPCFRHTLYSTVHVVCLNWRLWWSWQMMESWNQVVKKWEKHRSRWGSRGNGGKGLSLRMEFIS